MIRRLLVAAVVVSACVVCAGSAAAASKGKGSHASGHKTAHASSGAKGGTSSKPVHVKAYAQKDGIKVEAHDRKAPEPKSSTPHAEPVRATSPPIRLVTDPVTGRRTFTNEPLAPVPAKVLPFTAARTSTPAQATPPRAVTSRRTPPTVVARRVAPTGPITPSITTTRDARGRMQRSAAARHAFARQTGFPNGRPGYVIDHITPLACGGADASSNMQWQTIAAAKAKDKVERIGCR